MGHRDTTEVIKLFNDAFLERDAAKLDDLVADDCVMESAQPAPNWRSLRAVTPTSASGRN